jgi:iron complex outermembrane recepter protein
MTSKAGLLWTTDRIADGAPHYLNFSGPSLSDPNNFVFNSYGNGQNYHNKDSGYAYTLSGAYVLDGLFTKLRFGARQAYQHDTFTNFGFGRDLTTDRARLNASQSNAIQANTLAGNLQQAPSNFMNGEAGYAGGYLVYNPNALLGNQVMTAFPNANIPGMPYPENLGARQVFGEHDSAAYLVGDFSAFDEKIRGNVGVRLVHTKTQAMARTTNPAGQIVDVERTNTYTNVLPTFNLTYNVTPDTLVRVGMGRGMTRPGLGDLNPSVNYNTSNGTGNIGNTSLKPLVADSYDLSLEHYFNKTNYAAVALFNKEISDFPNGVLSCETIAELPAYDPSVTLVDNGCTNGQYKMRKAVNSEKGYARGIEVSGQMFFDSSYGILNNFGVSGSYSYAKTANPINLGTVAAPQIVETQQPFQSKNNFSLTGMYEGEKFSARLAYTWRSESILFNVDTGGPIWARYIKSYGLLDGSMSYEIAKNTTLQFSAVNILNKAANRSLGEPGPNAIPVEYQHFVNGRNFSLGLRYKFGN